MKKIATILLFITSLTTIAQINFEKGYYIDNNDIKHEGLIKNIQWKNNPSEIEYKLSNQTTSLKLSIQDVSSFYVGGQQFKRFTGQIDRSSSILEKMNSNKNPVFKEETIFILLLVDGPQKLYSYNDKSLSRYFYGTNDSDITQLVYKKYIKSQSTVGENNLYQQQILQHLKCHSINENRIQKTAYIKNDLVDLFKEYNICINPEITFETVKNKGRFLLNIRPGVSINEFKITNDKQYFDEDEFLNFGNTVGFRIGIEGEYIMPFNKNKWSLAVEPAFQFFNDSGYNSDDKPSNISYTAFELPIGLRHYLFLKNGNKFFINASLMLIFPINSKVEIEDSYNFTFQKSPNYALGLGYKFKDKFSFEFQYKGSQNWYYDPSVYARVSELRSMSFIVGYTMF